MEYFYFHNCLYERVWQDNRRRAAEVIATHDLLRTYPHDYKVVIVGDASMSPYEIVYPGGSVEHWNEEAGEVWIRRLLDVYARAVWLNPIPEKYWGHTASIAMIRELMGNRMFPLTLDGLDQAMRELMH